MNNSEQQQPEVEIIQKPYVEALLYVVKKYDSFSERLIAFRTFVDMNKDLANRNEQQVVSQLSTILTIAAYQKSLQKEFVIPDMSLLPIFIQTRYPSIKPEEAEKQYHGIVKELKRIKEKKSKVSASLRKSLVEKFETLEEDYNFHKKWITELCLAFDLPFDKTLKITENK